MSRATSAELLPVLRERYGRRGRQARARMLDEFCEQFGYSRKHAIKVLRAKLPPPGGRPRAGPVRIYDADVLRVTKALWLASDQLCGKRLAPALALWLPFYEAREGRLPVRLRRKVLAISPATLDRLLAPARAAQPRRGLCGTKPGSLLRTQIPIHNEAWDVSQPGWLEADTVAHCGSSLAGDFIWSVTYTDIFSQWTESRAVWNKGAAGVVTRTREVEATLPFLLLGFDSDNGGEFLNYHLWRYFSERAAGLPNSWTYAQGADGPATLQSTPSSPFININPFGAASVLLTDGATTTVTPNLLQSFTTQTGGILNVAWDFRFNSKTGSPWSVQIDDAVTAQTKFNMDSAGNFVVENPLGATTTIVALAANTWYQVQLALDMSSKTLSGTITSESLITTAIGNQSWRVTGGSGSINRVLILDDPTTAAAAGNMLIDNFSADRTAFAAPAIVPEPSALLLLGLGGAFAAARRRR